MTGWDAPATCDECDQRFTPQLAGQRQCSQRCYQIAYRRWAERQAQSPWGQGWPGYYSPPQGGQGAPYGQPAAPSTAAPPPPPYGPAVHHPAHYPTQGPPAGYYPPVGHYPPASHYPLATHTPSLPDSYAPAIPSARLSPTGRWGWDLARAWGAVIGSFVALIAAIIALVILLEVVEMVGLPVGSDLESLLFDLTLLGGVFGLLWWKMGRAGLRRLFSLGRPGRVAALVLLVFVVNLFVVLPAAILLTEIAFPDAPDQEVKEELEAASSATAIWLLVFKLVILAPILEESFLRGFILQNFSEVHHRWLAVVLTAAFFALLHERTAILAAFGGGVLYGWLRLKTGSLLPPIICHALWNGLVTLVVLLA